jgi:hypothetical protein
MDEQGFETRCSSDQEAKAMGYKKLPMGQKKKTALVAHDKKKEISISF